MKYFKKSNNAKINKKSEFNVYSPKPSRWKGAEIKRATKHKPYNYILYT